MPQLLVLAAGRQIITDKESSLVTIVSVFSGFSAQIQKDDAQLAPVAPLDWGLVAIFKRTQEDTGKVYELRFRLIEPDGNVNFEVLAQFAMTELTHSLPVRSNGFPVAQEGTYTVTASLREYDTEAEWQEVGQYPIDVIYLPPKESEAPDE